MTPHVQVASLLIDLEAELRQLGLWQAERPSEADLASTEPFAVDTLTFPQWVQFIFIKRLSVMVREESPLPTSCAIAPMAEESFREANLPVTKLLAVFKALDTLMSCSQSDCLNLR